MIRARDEDGTLRSWPLYVLAAPATVAVWSGWVGLGEMTGFGKVHPLPGIWDSATINTAITLPIGVEAYAAYALGAWLTKKTLSSGTRTFARLSALGALALGACGQIAYHLLAAGAPKLDQQGHPLPVTAPSWITTIVACLPVLVLGMGATLAHLIHRDGEIESATDEAPATATPMAPGHPAKVDRPTAELAPASMTPDHSEQMVRTINDTVVRTTDEPPAESTPAPMVQITAEPTGEATPKSTRRTTAKGGSKGGSKPKRRTRDQLRKEVEREVAEIAANGGEIQVKPIADKLRASRTTVRELLDEMNIRPMVRREATA